MKKFTILLRSAWQVINIGDIAHTPGVLTLIETHMPEAEVILWASHDFTQEVLDMIKKRFPKLETVKGCIGEDGKASNQELERALEKSDFLLHGSGPLLVAHDDVAAYIKHVRKPFGVFGITYGGYDEYEWVKDVLNKAEFIYFRDSTSLEKAKNDGINSPIMKFGPDAAFAVDLRNDLKAKAFLNENNIKEGQFLCCIPRLRYTPFWKVKNVPFNEEKHSFNEKMKEHDHAALLQAIIELVRKTKFKVLICPEDMTQMEMGKELLFDKLPADVKPSVVWREQFWLTDEALSVYRLSAGLFGNEMHSPIMCIGNGIPAIVCRSKEQTSKGYMWQDIGLGDWLFDIDNKEEMMGLVPMVLNLAAKQETAKEKALAARERVEMLQKEMLDTLKKQLKLCCSKK